MWTLHSPEIHFRYKRERVCRRTTERTRWLLWIANAYLWQRLDRLYIYTHLFLPPPLVLLLPHYSQPHPAFSPVRSTGQTDVFTSYDGLILTLSHFSWLYGSWIKKMQQSTCVNWEEGTYATRLWKTFLYIWNHKKCKDEDSIWMADKYREARQSPF